MRTENQKKKKNKKAGTIIRVVVGILFFYIISAAVPPLFQKEVRGEVTIDYGSENTAEERIKLIDDNKEALLWRLRLIENAENSIIMSTFDFRDDMSGRDIMSALNEAAGRGVHVKILVDGIAGERHLNNSDSFKELTENENIEVKFYNKINMLTPWKGNYRMHDKYLIADDKAFILGGRNTFDLFLGEYGSSQNEDRDILVYETEEGKGSSYIQLVNYFEEIWELNCCKRYTSRRNYNESLRNHYTKMKVRYGELQEETDWVSETIAAEGISLLSNPINASNKEPVLWNQMVSIMGTNSEVTIISPYIVMNDDMYDDIKELEKNDTDISVITNAHENGANPFGCTDYINEKDEILNSGVRVYEYWGRHSLHTKTVLVGNDISIVGSFNLDMRSTYLDTELMLCIKSSELNEMLKEKAQDQMDQSKCVESGKEDFYGKDYEIRTIRKDKKIQYSILRRLIKPFRQLL